MQFKRNKEGWDDEERERNGLVRTKRLRGSTTNHQLTDDRTTNSWYKQKLTHRNTEMRWEYMMKKVWLMKAPLQMSVHYFLLLNNCSLVRESCTFCEILEPDGGWRVDELWQWMRWNALLCATKTMKTLSVVVHILCHFNFWPIWVWIWWFRRHEQWRKWVRRIKTLLIIVVCLCQHNQKFLAT